MGKVNSFYIPAGFVMGLLLVVLSGCDTPANTTASSPQKNAGQTHTAKPGASVKLENSQPFFLAEPGIGSVELQLSSPSMDGVMEVDIAASTGLEIISLPLHYELPLTGAVQKIPLQVRAVTEGRYYINLQITTASENKRDHRVITAIVQVGEPARKSQKSGANTTENSTEDKVISLPAQETVKPNE